MPLGAQKWWPCRFLPREMGPNSDGWWYVRPWVGWLDLSFHVWRYWNRRIYHHLRRTCLHQAQWLSCSYTLSTFNKYRLDAAWVCRHQSRLFGNFYDRKDLKLIMRLNSHLAINAKLSRTPQLTMSLCLIQVHLFIKIHVRLRYYVSEKHDIHCHYECYQAVTFFLSSYIFSLLGLGMLTLGGANRMCFPRSFYISHTSKFFSSLVRIGT